MALVLLRKEAQDVEEKLQETGMGKEQGPCILGRWLDFTQTVLDAKIHHVTKSVYFTGQLCEDFIFQTFCNMINFWLMDYEWIMDTFLRPSHKGEWTFTSIITSILLTSTPCLRARDSKKVLGFAKSPEFQARIPRRVTQKGWPLSH